jgi:hypothetical protein
MNFAFIPRSILVVLLFATLRLEAADKLNIVMIQNDALRVSLDPAAGRFSVQAIPDGKPFVVDAAFAGTSGAVKIAAVNHEVFGAGQEIEITYANGNRDHLALFPHLPFALLRSTLHNGTPEATVTANVPLLSANLDLGKPPSDLKALGTGGLTTIDKCPGSYAWLAIADPQTRRGVVTAWLTHDRASGVIFPKLEGDKIRIEARGDYGHLRIAPGKDAETETLAIGAFDDARLGLEAWADAVAKVYHVKLPPQPVGYCTWYSDKHGGASNEKYLAEIADFAAKNLKPFGFQFVQIDDGWQLGEKLNGPKKNFAAFNPKGAYAGGMKETADHLKSLGLTPGVWFMPFAGTFNDPVFKEHQDWFAKKADGSPFDTAWGGTCLDMTHPGAREYLRGVVHRIAHEWGYTYFKMDGMYTGTATRQVYINSGYKDDHIGESILHDPDKTNIEAYRDGIKLVREAAGPGVFILGCCAPQNMRSYAGAFGLVDAMRIGPDNKATWDGLTRGTLFGSRNYFLHGRIWYNDPDPLYVREKLPLAQAQLLASWVTISGQLSASSDWLPDLSPERLSLLRRTMPSHGLLPRPVDLFEHDLPRIWLLTDTRRLPRRDVIALYNWDDKPADLEDSMAHIGLDAETTYVAFDYWANTLVPPIKGTLKSSLPKQSCQVLAVRPQSAHPQLISSSRHITQGIVDVLEEKWNEAGKTLTGKSKVVGGDPYELRIVPGNRWLAQAAEVSAEDQAAGVNVSFKESDGLIRATIESAASREVVWWVRFKN